MFGGNTGIFRLLQTGLGDQAGWLLGFAAVAGVALLVCTSLRRTDPRTGWLIAVGGAFATTAIVFSFASGIFHPYYVSLLAPFTAALIGAGVGLALSGGRTGRMVAPLAVAAGAVAELVVLGTVGRQLSWAKPVVMVVATLCAVALAFALAPRTRWVVLAVALAALLAAPATWAAETLGHASSSTFPTGGPPSASAGFPGGLPRRAGAQAGIPGLPPGAGGPGGAGRLGGGPAPVPGGAPGLRAGAPGGGPGGFDADSSTLSTAIKYAQVHGGGTIGVASQSSAAAAILSTHASVAGLGGFSGRESAVSTSWMAMQVRTGHLRWVITDSIGSRVPGDSRQGSRAALDVVARTCRAAAVKSSTTTITMYDCQGRAAAIQAAAGGR